MAEEGAAPAAGTVLALAGRLALERGHRLLDARVLEERCAQEGVVHDLFVAAVRELADERLVNAHFFGLSQITLLRLTDEGVRHHLAATRPDLEEARRRVVDAARVELSAGRRDEPVDLASASGEPPLLVELVLEELRDLGLAVFSRAPRGKVRVHRLGAPDGSRAT